MDLSEYLKMKFRQERAEKRKSLRANQLLARRNIDDGMSPYCTPLVEKRDLQNGVHKKPRSKTLANRRKQWRKLLEPRLAQWKADNAKQKQLEKAKRKPIFKVQHIETSLSVNLENVNKMIKGQFFKKSLFAPEHHKFRAPSGIKPIEFRCQSALSKALSMASKPSTRFQKASYRSESIRNKNTIDGIGQKNLVKNTNSLGSSTNIIKTRSTTLKSADGSKNYNEPGRSTTITDKPGPSAYNTRAKARAKIDSIPTIRLEQNKAKNTSKPVPIQNEKCVNRSNKPNNSSNKLESDVSKTSTVKNSKSQTTPKTEPKTGLRNKSGPTPTTEPTTKPNKTKATPNFIARNIKNISSANKQSKLGSNTSKTCNNRVQTTPMTLAGLKSKLKPRLKLTSTSLVTPTTFTGLRRKSKPSSKPASNSKITQPRNSKNQVTSKIDSGLRRGQSCTEINLRTPRRKEETLKVGLDIPDSRDLKLDHGNVFADKTLENIKEATVGLPRSPDYISPFVTVSRGKRSARDEYRVRKSMIQDKNKMATPENLSGNLSTLTSAQAGANYFMAKLDSEIVRINAKCSEWEIYRQDPELPEEAQSSIDVTIGQSKLLIAKKFKQFRGLINQCISQNYEEKEITCEDLHGFWDMVYMQVENLDTRFDNLHKLKDNNWSEMLAEQVEVVKKPKVPAKKTKAKVTVPKARTGVRDMIKAARAKQKGDNQEENVFSGGYFEVRTPVKDRKNTPRSSTNKRRSRLSVLTSERTSSSSSSPVGLTIMKLSQSIKQNNGLTPSKGILKVSARKSTGIKKVVFEDTIRSTQNIRKTILFTNDNGESTNVDNGKTTTRKDKEGNKENTPVRRSSRLLHRAPE